MGITTENITEIATHWGLLTAIGAVGYGLFRLIKGLVTAYRAAKEFIVGIVDERMPTIMKATLNNGLRDMTTQVVTEVVVKAIKDHEIVEEDRLKTFIVQKDDQILRRVEEIDIRLSDVEGCFERKGFVKRRKR